MSKDDYMPSLKDIIQDLQLAKEIAIKNENVNGLINSVMSQAKLLGLDNGVTEDEEVQPVKVVIQVEDARINHDGQKEVSYEQ